MNGVAGGEAVMFFVAFVAIVCSSSIIHAFMHGLMSWLLDVCLAFTKLS